jgi:hypothetical protein
MHQGVSKNCAQIALPQQPEKIFALPPAERRQFFDISELWSPPPPQLTVGTALYRVGGGGSIEGGGIWGPEIV